MNVEYRAVVHYLWLLGKQPQEIYDSMVEAYGEGSFSLSFVKKWKVMFDNGRTGIEDQERTGRPFEKENVDKVNQYIKDYPFSSARSVASALDIDKKTVVNILTKVLHRKKRHAKWIPHFLNEDQIEQRLNVSRALFERILFFKPPKFNCVITCDESWFYLNYFNDSAYLEDGQTIEVPKRMISDQKIMIFTAFSAQGLIMIEMLPQKCIFNSSYMCETILPKLNQNARSRPEIGTRKKIFIHMDNAKPHQAKIVKEKMKSLNMEELPHPAYSPDLSPNDFWFYGFIKEKLKGRIHNSPEELLRSIYEIVKKIDKRTWMDVMDSWKLRLEVVIRSQGSYL